MNAEISWIMKMVFGIVYSKQAICEEAGQVSGFAKTHIMPALLAPFLDLCITREKEVELCGR